MYVIWKKRRIRTHRPERVTRPLAIHCPHTTNDVRYSLVPILVRSRRVNGKPRQLHIAPLPAIRTCCRDDPIVRAAWWEQVEQSVVQLSEMGKFDFLADDPRDVRNLIRQMLVDTVPFPTPAERRAHDARQIQRAREEGRRMRADLETAQIREKERLRQEEERLRQEQERQRQAQSHEQQRRMQEEEERRRQAQDRRRREAQEAESRQRKLEEYLRNVAEQNQRLQLQPYLSALGLQWPCTEDAVKKAYRNSVLKHHPDRGGNPEDFKHIKVAYDKLTAACKLANAPLFGS